MYVCMYGEQENQRVAKERRDLKKRVEFNLTQKREKKESQISAVTREKTLQSLDEFDSKLEQLIVTNAETINSTGQVGLSWLGLGLGLE